MKTLATLVVLITLCTSVALAGTTLADFNGTVDVASESRITVLGKTFPVSSRVKVVRRSSSGGERYESASFYQVAPGVPVTLVLDGNLVVKIIIER